jgi:hypothetical protein
MLNYIHMPVIFQDREKKDDIKWTILKFIQIRKEVGFQLYSCDVRASYGFSKGGAEFRTSF